MNAKQRIESRAYPIFLFAEFDSADHILLIKIAHFNINNPM